MLIHSTAPVKSSVPSISAQFTSPSLELVLTKATTRIANHVRNAEVEGLDPFLMVITDQIGDLIYSQGDLSFLMPSAPVLNTWFADQINRDVADEYNERQLAVWQERLVDGEQFQVSAEFSVCILPFLAEEERFTVTVFIRRTTKQRNF
jgi:hypothetical protein